MLTKLFESKFFDSKIKSANTQNSERWLGYFFGPCLLYMCYYGIAGTYLTQFYTVVLCGRADDWLPDWLAADDSL